MYNGDLELASQWLWNKDRRVGPKPTTTAQNLTFKCLQATEDFEERDCFGRPHETLFKPFDLTSWFNYLIGDWIKIE